MRRGSFNTPQDAAMHAAISSIPERLYKGSRDARDAQLALYGEDNAITAVPVIQGPTINTQDKDGNNLFMLTSSLMQRPGMRTMAFTAMIAELEPINTPPGLLTPQLCEWYVNNGGSPLKDVPVRVCKVWQFDAFAGKETVHRNPHAIVTIGDEPLRALILYPNVPPSPMFEELAPLDALAQLPIPAEQEHDVQRFNRIIKGLGFGSLQLT